MRNLPLVWFFVYTSKVGLYGNRVFIIVTFCRKQNDLSEHVFCSQVPKMYGFFDRSLIKSNLQIIVGLSTL